MAKPIGRADRYMNGCRRPHLERSRSDARPMAGSTTASITNETNITRPATPGRNPTTLTR